MPPDSQSGSGLAMLAALTSKGGATSNNVGGAIAGDLLGMKSSGALFVGVLGSRTVQDRVVNRFDLRKVYAVKLVEDARKKLSDNTGLAEDRKSGIITITVADHDPHRAAAMAQTYATELNQLVAELSTSSARRERIFLEGRLNAVKQDLDDASEKFSQFASKNTAIDIKEQGRAMVEAAARLQGEMIAARSQLSGLEEIYTVDNVRVKAVRARIAELQRQLDKLGGKGLGDAALKQDAVDTGYPSIRELPLLGVTYADLYRRARIQEAVFEVLTQQYELAKVQEAKEIPTVKILDSAGVPERKSFPPRLLITAIAGLILMGAAAFVVLVRDWWARLDARDPGRLFATEVFATVNESIRWQLANGSQEHAQGNGISTRASRNGDSEQTSESGSNRP
jgi:capsule polysaccharide export protein KpsE/RkpR